MNEWQPIETAPKDGRTIDLWVEPSPDYPIWRQGRSGRLSDMYWSPPFLWFKGYWASREGLMGLRRTIATHWRLPPAPPTVHDLHRTPAERWHPGATARPASGQG